MAEPGLEQHFTSGFELVSYHDLEGKPAFKLAMQVVGDRWYLHLSQFWQRLFSIYEVTDPGAPRKVAEIPGPPNTWTLQVQVADE